MTWVIATGYQTDLGDYEVMFIVVTRQPEYPLGETWSWVDERGPRTIFRDLADAAATILRLDLENGSRRHRRVWIEEVRP